MSPTKILPGDRVLVLDTDYTRSHGHLRECVGKVGQVTSVDTYDGMSDLLGFEAIYTVTVGPYDLSLIDADVQLVERAARITG